MSEGRPVRRWRGDSIALIVMAWLVLQMGGLFSPGLLDDVDSVYIQVAREMLARHDYVTPMVDGVRFFDKPPLMYWMAALSMKVFGVHDWAARLPLALGVLGLLLAAYFLGIRLFAEISPKGRPDRGGLYAGLAIATSVGPYLYTRFYIPDILIALWMMLTVHLTLVGLARARAGLDCGWVSAGFGAVLAANMLTKGLIGLVFPLGFLGIYLVLTGQWRLLGRMKGWVGGLVFLGLAVPWHVMAAVRNPAIDLPAGMGLPARGGWAWFYLYNEHVARFLAKRVPHDYGVTPVWLYLVYALVWAMPYVAFVPGAVAIQGRRLRKRLWAEVVGDEALAVWVWALLVLGFFAVSNRQEYYSLPAIPALLLLAGGVLARADRGSGAVFARDDGRARRSVFLWTKWFLLPLTTLVAVVCGYFAVTAPRPAAGVDLSAVLASNPAMYNVSLGHLFDLTGRAMGLFRGPLIAVTVGMLLVGVGSFALRKMGHSYSATMAVVVGMTLSLLAAHEGLVRFNPILGSKGLAEAINQVRGPGDLIVLDGELTSGSTLLFYTGQPVVVVNGRVNGLWYGSFWPDAPKVFASDDDLRAMWGGGRRVFLLTYSKDRVGDLGRFGVVKVLASGGGKMILTNR
jgi:4-amino-4-deoxy-L-arabinose transferase-like glycosyltransferase